MRDRNNCVAPSKYPAYYTHMDAANAASNLGEKIMQTFKVTSYSSIFDGGVFNGEVKASSYFEATILAKNLVIESIPEDSAPMLDGVAHMPYVYVS